MPRPVSPPLLALPLLPDFSLGDSSLAPITAALGYKVLPPEFIAAIEAAIACHLAILADAGATTVQAVATALRELKGNGRKQQEAISRLADDRWGGDQESHALLQPLARLALTGDGVALTALTTAADRRILELRIQPRVRTDTEALKHFCGILRVLFNHMIATDAGRTWQNCEEFARSVFAVAGIECHHLFEHPARLRNYLGTDVTPPNSL